MILEHLSFNQCGWFSGGASRDVTVLSSRVRLARNLADVPFTNWADSTALVRVRDRILAALHKCLDNNPLFPPFEFLLLDDMPQLDREFLGERNLISREMVTSTLPRAVAVSEDETISIMVNEEDHLRLQCIRGGRDLQGAWHVVNQIDDLLTPHLDFAFSPRWGYLTACPTNVGTGIRGSTMLHLAGLTFTGKAEPMLKKEQRNGMAIRGLGGEGTEITGNIFQVSNQITLGTSEQEILDTLGQTMDKLVEAEERATRDLMEQARAPLEDKIWRDCGLLASARSISTEETRRLLSSVRLGIGTGIIPHVSLDTVNELLLCTGAAHLQKIAGREMEQNERDRFRAEFVRERIKLS